MSELKRMEQQLVKAGNVKGMLQLGWVKDRAIKNYQATTGRKDAENWFQQEAFAMMSIMAEKPELMKAEPLSIIAALVKAGTLGLRISDGHVDLIKYGNILKAEPNYKGHREQLRRMETIKEVGEGQVVYKGDDFVVDKLNNKIIKHESKAQPEKITLDVIVAAYVRVTFTDGSVKDVVVYHEALVKAKNKSKVKGEDAPWNVWLEQMCKKVPIHRANTIYYRRPDHEVIVNPIEGDVDETLDIQHEEQAAETPTPAQEEPKPKPDKQQKVEEAQVVSKTKTESDVDEFIKNS